MVSAPVCGQLARIGSWMGHLTVSSWIGMPCTSNARPHSLHRPGGAVWWLHVSEFRVHSVHSLMTARPSWVWDPMPDDGCVRGSCASHRPTPMKTRRQPRDDASAAFRASVGSGGAHGRWANTSKYTDEVTAWLRLRRLDERALLLRHAEIGADLSRFSLDAVRLCAGSPGLSDAAGSRRPGKARTDVRLPVATGSRDLRI